MYKEYGLFHKPTSCNCEHSQTIDAIFKFDYGSFTGSLFHCSDEERTDLSIEVLVADDGKQKEREKQLKEAKLGAVYSEEHSLPDGAAGIKYSINFSTLRIPDTILDLFVNVNKAYCLMKNVFQLQDSAEFQRDILQVAYLAVNRANHEFADTDFFKPEIDALRALNANTRPYMYALQEYIEKRGKGKYYDAISALFSARDIVNSALAFIEQGQYLDEGRDLDLDIVWESLEPDILFERIIDSSGDSEFGVSADNYLAVQETLEKLSAKINISFLDATMERTYGLTYCLRNARKQEIANGDYNEVDYLDEKIKEAEQLLKIPKYERPNPKIEEHRWQETKRLDFRDYLKSIYGEDVWIEAPKKHHGIDHSDVYYPIVISGYQAGVLVIYETFTRFEGTLMGVGDSTVTLEAGVPRPFKFEHEESMWDFRGKTYFKKGSIAKEKPKPKPVRYTSDGLVRLDNKPIPF